MTATKSQALCGPFLSTDLPDFQAAVLHVQTHWQRLLSATQLEIVQAIVNRTARFGQRVRRIPTEWFYDGHDDNPETGYAGVPPITPVSLKGFYEARNELVRLGILSRDDETYAIDYSVTAIDLAMDEDVQRRVVHTNKRGGILSTVEGLIEWAASIIRYTVRSYKTHVSEDKSSECSGGYFMDKVREFFMGKRSAADVLASVQSTVAAARETLATKRRSRATLADMCSLFENAWNKGQRERTRSIPPTRLVPRDRSLLKTQLVMPFRDSDMQIEDFAYWVAKHWDAIGAQYFQKSKAYPEVPAFRWLVTCLETYTLAYQHRDSLDPTGTPNTAQRVSAGVLAASKADAAEALAIAKKQIADLQAQLKEAGAEAVKVRRAKGLPLDDDPVYARVIQKASRKITIGNYDDDEDAKPRKLRRLRK